MRRRSARSLLAVIALLAVPFPIPRAHSVEEVDAARARAAFARLVALEGRWRSVSTKGWDETTTYQVIARGSVVMSTTTFRDAPDRTMVTMFYVDDGRLVATHYCEARNQPHLIAENIDADARRVVFRFAGGGNLADRDQGHMDQAVYEFLGPDRIRSRWTWFQQGEEQWLEDIEITRLQ